MTKNPSILRISSDRITWILFALVAVAVYFCALDIPLIGPDEPRYSQVAREMFERGDWVTPTLGGFDWFEKPALLYWLQITFYNLFGVSEFSARFGSALFGLGTVFALWLLGKKTAETNYHEISDQRTNDKRQTANDNFANWLALISASSIGLLAFSRGASFDIILTFPITAALVSFFIWENTNRKSQIANRKFLFGFYFFVGIALIAKGLVGLVFPLAIVAFYYVLSLRWPSKTLILSLFWGVFLSVLVSALWYWPMYQVNGWKFIDEFFIQHHFQRYTSNKYLHPQPFWFFWVVLPLMTVPWIPFFFAAIWKIVKGFFNRRDVENVNEKNLPPLFVFALAWMLVPLVFFSASGSKLPGYILPALPAALILTADFVFRFAQKSWRRKLILQFVAVLTFLCVAVLARFVVADFLREETVWHLVETANARGLTKEKIINMHTISHSAEFYGAGRLVRLPDGKQRKFYGVVEILEQMKNDRTDQILVIVPLEYLYTLNKPEVKTEVLDENGEMAMVLVKIGH